MKERGMGMQNRRWKIEDGRWRMYFIFSLSVFLYPLSSIFCLLFTVVAANAQTEGASSKIDALKGITIEQRLNEQIPLEVSFRDETGRTVQLRDYFGEKPVILALVYYECPMLCSMILNGLLKSLNALSFDVGDEFNVVTVSFDPDETPKLAAGKKRTYMSKYGRKDAENGWHFLTGDSTSIRKLTASVGFNYRYDPETDQFYHTSGIMVLTPNGRLSKYFYGVEYSVKDLKFGLMEAASNKIGSPVDQLLLYCYHYDPTTGKYGVVIMNVIRVFGTATVLALVSFMLVMFRRDQKSKKENRGTNHAEVEV